MPKNKIGSLVRASRKGNLERIKQLLNSGIDVNATNKYDEYPLNKALDSKSVETIRLLLDAGANASDVLENAISKDNTETVELLLKAGTDTNINLHGRTPLVTAIWFSNLEVTKLLLDYGADVNAKSNHRTYGTALDMAWKQDNFLIIDILNKHEPKFLIDLDEPISDDMEDTEDDQSLCNEVLEENILKVETNKAYKEILDLLYKIINILNKRL